jgi:hypothetical protein
MFAKLFRWIFGPFVSKPVGDIGFGTEFAEKILEGSPPMGPNGALVQDGKVISFQEAASGYEKEYCMNDKPGWVSFVPCDVSTCKVGDLYDHDTNTFTPAAARSESSIAE